MKYEENNISDMLAMSIRGLWHIETMEEKKKIIRHYDNLYRMFSLVKNRPELFKSDELEKWKLKREALTEDEEKLINEIFLALYMGVINEPPEYTVDEVKDLYSKGLYFTKDELEEYIEWQFIIDDEKHNPELVILLEKYLEKHLYFDTIEEAERTWDEYVASKKENTILP